VKILGTTKDGFILEASEDEVAKLIGFYSAYNGTVRNLKIGDEIKVNQMFDQLYAVKNIQSAVKNLREGATELLRAIETKNPILQPVCSEIEKHAKK